MRNLVFSAWWVFPRRFHTIWLLVLESGLVRYSSPLWFDIENHMPGYQHVWLHINCMTCQIMYIYIYVYTYTQYIDIYIYIHTHIHIHVHIHMYISHIPGEPPATGPGGDDPQPRSPLPLGGGWAREGWIICISYLYPSIYLSIYLSIYMCIYIYIHIHIYIYIYIYICIYM